VAEAARQAEVPASTLRYDLDKLDKALPEVLVNQTPGPKHRSSRQAEALVKSDKQSPSLVRDVAVRSRRMGPIGC